MKPMYKKIRVYLCHGDFLFFLKYFFLAFDFCHGDRVYSSLEKGRVLPRKKGNFNCMNEHINWETLKR